MEVSRLRRCLHNYLLALAILPSLCSTALAFSSPWPRRIKAHPKPVVVVGKIILDEYGNPDDLVASDDIDASVGGGGPQAAWGAAAALAVLAGAANESPLPPPQPVTFVGPVGEDWTDQEEASLEALLGPVCETIRVVKAPGMRTPRIQIWHDDDQNVQWRALNDSFGPEGADGLWRNCPSASDILSTCGASEFVLHMILEVGANAPGKGYDAAPLRDPSLKEHITLLSVEPVAFLDDVTGEVSVDDAKSCRRIIQNLSPRLDFVCPDNHLHRALDPALWQAFQGEVVVRDGARGSVIFPSCDASRSANEIPVPAANLLTSNGQPVNPTGAGNAFSAAAAACLGAGLSVVDASIVATAIGAVVCEYEHLPPWSSDVLKRIGDAAEEVRGRVSRQADEKVRSK